MDIFRRKKFDEAMFAKNRTLAIRVGQYQSSDIKEAHFDYGYIKGDTYKPGGTCAGSAKITFTRIITTFNKLDKIYPEIGLLVDGTYEWVKMGEYFINDIEIDRNRKTTKLDLMDGMFKLNREYVTDLTYPAEIRHVIKEVCLKTGITLANEYMDITSMNYRIEQIPKNKKMTFRDVLSLASQMLGMSCFFNREGKLEIKELTDSGITITADSYFMHGLTKSEIEYQIAGISCKKDKETLTVGMRTGRSLELDNLFMSQTVLDNLYHKIKNIRYYPFNLNYQGHLLLNVGEWVTIKTNTGETFKSPVLSQLFTFKGGLRGRISADSKAGNDAQYSYAGTITKKIVQFNEFEAQIQNQIEEADNDFDQKVAKIKKDFNDQFELAKARAEEIKRQISSEIDKKFQSFDNASIQEAKRKAEEALRSAGASSSLAQEAKRISERARADLTNLQVSSQNALSQIEAFKTEYGTKLNEVKSTADGILTKIGTIETYINKDGQRQESLQRYARDESARQASAIREQISRDYVGKSAYQEDVRGLERRFSAISTQTNNDIATKIAQYKQTVDGQFASITSQIAGKVNQTDFQRVRETSQLYERIIGSNENAISNKVARMALTNQLFQVEVAKNIGSDNNLIVRSKAMDRHTLVNEGNTKRVFVNNGIFSIRCTGNSGYTFAGFTLPLYIDRMARGETYTLNFKYRIMGRLDHNFVVVAKNHGTNETAISSDVATSSTAVSSSWKEFNETYTISRDFEFGNSDKYPLYFYLAKNGWVEIKEIMLVRATQTHGYKASQFDDMSEAVRSVQSQLAGSWSVQNINSAGDLISGINLGANGHNRITGKLTHITGETLIDKAVIKSAMVDKLTTGNFEAGSVTTVVLDAEAVTADKVRMDQAFANKLVASNIFTDTLAAKQAFINKLRSVVVTATLLEGYKGKIGGFQIGTHDKDPNSYWLTGQNQFAVGMGSGNGRWGQTALWVNWGNNWEKPGNYAWYVKNNGEMYCYNQANFWNRPIVHGNLEVTGNIVYTYDKNKEGYWISSPKYSRIDPSSGYLYLYYSGSGYDWIPMNKEISDRRYKNNIEDSTVSGLDIVNSLKTYSYRKEYDGKIEDIACGIMAQDVQKYAPEAFFENPDGAYSYRTFELVPYLIKAIQELNQRLEKLEEIA
ncbi:tail fiber domain-containing protein [Streptococcus mitis]|uniref:tail fiber domain-containing protein n=1 Tax=Streptococcus mitis TaxID=28037 RepID=UPI0019139DFA|nr:tail fiber domain-containing protein [Streptococcus mitis]QQQ34732.1 tail fiber domain-containing protein [Streptococcus mitis]